MGDLTERKTPTFQKDVEYVPKTSVWAMLCFLLVITKNYVLRTSWCLSTWNYTGLLFNCRVTFRLRHVRKLGFLLWLFTSCVWDVLWYRILIKTTFVSWAKQKRSKTTLSTFQKCPFELCFAFFLVVTKKSVLRTSSDLSTWNNTCFLFKCRVTFRLRHFSKVRFGTLALYILRLRCLVISNTYKNSCYFLNKTETFQNDVEYVPKMAVWALLCVFLWS